MLEQLGPFKYCVPVSHTMPPSDDYNDEKHIRRLLTADDDD